MKRIFLAALITTALLVPAEAQPKRPRPRTKKATPAAKPAAPSNSMTTASGLTIVFTKRGTGAKPTAGQTVSVHYTGLLTDGTKFDSSRDRNEPIAFPLGQGRVIKGWDEGIAQLGVGDQAILIIPPTIGYGERGAGGVIPPNATLIFVVELVGIQ